jgi:hypothetical protein
MTEQFAKSALAVGFVVRVFFVLLGIALCLSPLIPSSDGEKPATAFGHIWTVVVGAVLVMPYRRFQHPPYFWMFLVVLASVSVAHCILLDWVHLHPRKPPLSLVEINERSLVRISERMFGPLIFSTNLMVYCLRPTMVRRIQSQLVPSSAA